ncbi:transport and Golgi organization protein 1 homolog [Sorex fumeus]|uniref:transport and Golgi organization protein 1 homolog n=1 Tax=Sorex fumeus TaxID=62283 RepID=UPI0024ADD4D9|nr:transport and Golgi organization protein 1 homolog [Sorex fumeus]
MAAAPGLPLPPRPLPPLPLLLLLPLLAPPAAPQSPGPAGGDRRFSEHKVCGDAECSLLMYQGEALEDFKGPDCRFVNFKKGDSVFVYYKLTGILPEVWAGSVGQAFGYFPKDFIRVAHEYTKEELQVPADETDFVCFNGGRDDFTNYSVEELLAYLELPSPASKDSEEAIEKASRHVEPPTEVSENRGPPSPPDSSSESSDTAAAASTQVPEDGVEAPMGQAQATPPSEPETVQQDAPQVPAGDSNRTSNSSQGPGEQPERMDAYKLLKQDMTLDLKTKFGSTADALVSDDETTRLVTSLEEDFDEDLEAEYYMMGQEEEEEEEDGIEDQPLLTFEDADDGADGPSPRRTGVGGGAAGREQNSSEEAREQVPQALGGATSSSHRPRDGSEQQAEHLNSEDAGGLSAAGSLGLDPPPPAAPELTGPVGALGALGIRGVFQASKAKASKVDADIHVPGKVAAERGPVLGTTEAESEQPPERGAAPPSVALGSQQPSGLAVGQGADAIPSAAASKDGNAADAVVHVSKEESGGEPTLTGGPGGDRSPNVSSAPVQGENKQQDVPRAEKDGVLGSFRPLDTLSRAAPKEASEEQQPPAPHPQPPGLEEGAPTQGRDGPGQLEQAVATEKEQLGTGKGRLWEEKAEEDFQEEEAGPGPLEADPTGQTGGAEAPDSHPGEAEAEAEADEYTPEEQLEDENALSAQQARGSSPASSEMQDWPPGADPQGPRGAAPGTPSSVLETQGHREEAGRRSEMGGHRGRCRWQGARWPCVTRGRQGPYRPWSPEPGPGVGRLWHRDPSTGPRGGCWGGRPPGGGPCRFRGAHGHEGCGDT